MGGQMQLDLLGSHPDESGLSILIIVCKTNQRYLLIWEFFFLKLTECILFIKVISNQVYDNRLIAADVTNKHIIDIPPAIILESMEFILYHFSRRKYAGSEEEVEL